MEDVRQFLDALKIERAIFVGHSWRGQLTRLAGEHPDRVIKLGYRTPAYDRARLQEIHKLLPPSWPRQRATGNRWTGFDVGDPDELWSEAWEANLREMMVVLTGRKDSERGKARQATRLLMQGTIESVPTTL